MDIPPPPPNWDDVPQTLRHDVNEPAAKEAAVAQKWKLRTLADAYKPRPPIDYIVDGVFAAASLNIVYGAPGSLKSMILADLCACVVAGVNWLKGATPGLAVKKTAVLWVDMDNGERRSDERFEAVGRARNLPPTAGLNYVTMPVPTYIASDTDSVAMLIDCIRECGAELVVIDNLGQTLAGTEENSSAMAQIMSYYRAVAERTQAAIVLVHHQRKSSGTPNGRAGDSLRGSGAIEGAIDLAVLVSRESAHSPEIVLTSTKTRGIDFPTLTATFNYEHKQGTKDLERAWFSSATLAAVDSVRRAILQIVGASDEGVGRVDLLRQVAALTGVSRDGVAKRRLDELVAAGEVVERKGKTHGKGYVLAEVKE